MKIVFVLFLSLPAALLAQGLAGGWILPFGSSAAHVRNMISRQPPVCTMPANGDDHDCTGLVMEQLPTQGDYTVKPQPELWLGGLDAPFHFRTLLHFVNEDRQLTRADLMLDTERHKAEGRSAAELADVAGAAVLHELLGRYGVPLTISPACEPAEARRLIASNHVIDCNALWKSEGRSINLFSKYVGGVYSLTVRYTMFGSGL